MPMSSFFLGSYTALPAPAVLACRAHARGVVQIDVNEGLVREILQARDLVEAGCLSLSNVSSSKAIGRKTLLSSRHQLPAPPICSGTRPAPSG